MAELQGTGALPNTKTIFVIDDDEMIRALEKIMNQRLPRQTLPDFDYAAAAPAVDPSRVYEPRGPKPLRHEPHRRPNHHPRQK